MLLVDVLFILFLLAASIDGAKFKSCPLLSEMDAIREDNGYCPFIPLFTKNFIYRNDEPLTIWIRARDSGSELNYYNLEVIDINNRPVGTFLEADNICNSGEMATHNEFVQIKTDNIELLWKAPSTYRGDLFIRLSAGRVNPDGTTSVWLKCGQLHLLKHYSDIPTSTLQGIEDPLGLKYPKPAVGNFGSLAVPNRLHDNVPPQRSANSVSEEKVNAFNDENRNVFKNELRSFGNKQLHRENCKKKPEAQARTPTRGGSTFGHSSQISDSESEIDKQTKNYRKGSRGGSSDNTEPSDIFSKPNKFASKLEKDLKEDLKNIWQPAEKLDNNDITTDGQSWCKPYRSPRFEIIPNSGCTKYRMVPNYDVQSCSGTLVFSVESCSCTFYSPCYI